MESSEIQDQDSEYFHEYRLSWVAFIQPFFVFLVLCLLSIFLVAVSDWLCLVGVIGALTLFIYHVLLLRTVVLFTNSQGVWMFRGLLPWNKGVTGVKWRDLEEATFFMGFFSWAFNSYSIRVGHRFTRASELFISHVRFGKDAVIHINETHMRMLAEERASLST